MLILMDENNNTFVNASEAEVHPNRDGYIILRYHNGRNMVAVQKRAPNQPDINPPNQAVGGWYVDNNDAALGQIRIYFIMPTDR